MLAVQVNRTGAFSRKNIDAKLKEFHLYGRDVRLGLCAFDRGHQMPHPLFVHLCGADLNAFVGDVADASAKALLAELLFDIDACGLQVKYFAGGAGGEGSG